MSHIIFGCFDSEIIEPETIYNLKKRLQEKNIFFWIRNELDFYPDVSRMIEEQIGSVENIFAITSLEQQYNSDDLLFPYDKYTNEQLFADTTREFFSKCCLNNLNNLFWCLDEIVQRLHTKSFEVLVTEGYDSDFLIKNVDLREMRSDILAQVLNSFSIESCIYQIKV